MLAWLSANIGTILIALALVCVVALVIVKMCRDKKKGRSSCGGNCGHCPMGGSCHSRR